MSGYFVRDGSGARISFVPLICLLELSLLFGLQQCHPDAPASDLPNHTITIDSTCMYNPVLSWSLPALLQGDTCRIYHYLDSRQEAAHTRIDSVYIDYLRMECENSTTWPSLHALLMALQSSTSSLYVDLARSGLRHFRREMVPEEQQALYRHIMDVQKAIYGRTSLPYLEAVRDLADFFHAQQKYLPADSLYQYCIQTTQVAHPDQKAFLENLYFKLGRVKRQQSEYDNALANFFICRRLISEMGADSLLVRIDNEEGIVYGQQENYQAALAKVDSALTRANYYHDEKERRKANLIKGSILFIKRRYSEAYRTLVNNLQFSSSPENRIETYGRIIGILVRINALDSAQYYLDQASRLRQKPAPVSLAYFDYYCAQFYQASGQFEAAVDKINEAIGLTDPDIHFTDPLTALPSHQDGSLDEWVLYYLGYKASLLGDQYLKTGKQDRFQASLAIYAFIDDYLKNHFRYTDSGDELHAVNMMHEVYTGALSLLSRIARKDSTEAYDELMHQYGERMRYRALFKDYDLLQEISQNDPRLKKWTDTLVGQLNLVPVVWNPQRTLAGNAYAFDLARNALLDSLEKFYPMVYRMYFERINVPVSQILQWNDENRANIVTLFSSENGEMVGLVYGQGIRHFSVSADDSISHELNKYLTGGVSSQAKWPDRLALTKLIESYLEPGIRNVIMIVEGNLEKIPFGKYLGDRHAIYYSYTVDRLIEAPIPDLLHLEGQSILSLVQSDRRGEDLPYTFNEGKYLRQKYGRKATVFFGKNVTLKNFKAEYKNHMVYHFAMHGINSPSSPSESGIRLHDGLWSIVDIGKIDWTGKTIILNICDAGTGPVSSGMGVLSISKAFNNAKLIIAPIYQLDDNLGLKGLKEISNNRRMDELYRWIIY